MQQSDESYGLKPGVAVLLKHCYPGVSLAALAVSLTCKRTEQLVTEPFKKKKKENVY